MVKMIRVKVIETYQTTYELSNESDLDIESVLEAVRKNKLLPYDKKFVGLDEDTKVFVEKIEEEESLWSYDYIKDENDYKWVRYD